METADSVVVQAQLVEHGKAVQIAGIDDCQSIMRHAKSVQIAERRKSACRHVLNGVELDVQRLQTVQV